MEHFSNLVFINGKISRNNKERIILILYKLFNSLGLRHKVLEIIFLSESELWKIKKKFFPARKRKKVQVLAFPPHFPFFETDEPPYSSLGEIYLAAELTEQKFKSAVYMLIHGFSHLLGYTHFKKSDMLKMKKFEQKLWAEISSLV